MTLEDGVVYTPEQVYANRWLGEMTAGAIRKAAQKREIEHTRIRGRIGLTKANILAIQSRGFQPAKADRPASPPRRRTRRTVPAEVQPGVRVLQPRPEARRRRRAS